jgi:hypothetical protein
VWFKDKKTNSKANEIIRRELRAYIAKRVHDGKYIDDEYIVNLYKYILYRAIAERKLKVKETK